MNGKIQCPVCGTILNSPELQCRDYGTSGEVFDICRCPACLYAMTVPQPSPTEIGKYYQTSDYISHSETARGIVNKLYLTVRKTNTWNKIRLINRISPLRRNLLDVGCGTGYFLSACKKNGWDNVEGVEINDKARSTAETRTGQPIARSLDDMEATRKKFDLITLWHVFEHLHDVRKSFEQLKRLLTPTGLLIIALPNPFSADARYYGEYWAAYDVPRHLSHFSQHSINILAGQHSMQVLKLVPMKFDAYYISMLSEELKGQGKIRALLLGLWQGYCSNRTARKTGNYSSLIYICKEK
jgi:2-polyprenyl-3-methyl-5-hydroxy-6-metoxy-1,4-benzoquinol methylase